jgi:CBS domain-containing protein
MNLLKIARVPPLTVTPDTTVLEAIHKMVELRVGAVSIVENEDLVGIFTERDVMTKVASKGLSLDTTKLSDVMTTRPEVASREMNPSEALSIMVEKHVRHLPIVGEGMRLEGMLSVRHLLQRMVEDLSQELEALDNYVRADGPGG